MHLRGIIDHISFVSLQAAMLKRCKQTERETGMWRKGVLYLQRVSYFVTLLLLGTFYQPNMCLFDALGMTLNNKLSLWCVQEQLGQILLILPCIHALACTLYALYYFYWGKEAGPVLLLLLLFTQVSVLLLLHENESVYSLQKLNPQDKTIAGCHQ